MGNNYIVAIPNEKMPETKAITWQDLYAAKFTFKKSFDLYLADGQVFKAEEVLRIVPKKRLVVRGLWQDKPAIAKLFFDHQGKRQAEKDLAGNTNESVANMTILLLLLLKAKRFWL